jgi:hypothetical protein
MDDDKKLYYLNINGCNVLLIDESEVVLANVMNEHFDKVECYRRSGKVCEENPDIMRSYFIARAIQGSFLKKIFEKARGK